MDIKILKSKIRFWLIIFVIGLVISGATAFPLVVEIKFLSSISRDGSYIGQIFPALSSWIGLVEKGILETHAKYPFMAYGTDWLAFAHLVIAIAFIGPIEDPVKNIWVIEFGMIACVLVVPVALICGIFREIPLFWRFIDCSFGIFGIIPLYISRKYTKQIIAQQA